MNKHLPTLSLASMILASGCVSESFSPRYQSVKGPPTTWESPAGDFNRQRDSRFFLPAQTRPVYNERYAGVDLAEQTPLPDRAFTGVSGLPVPRNVAPLTGYHARHAQYTSNPIYGQRSQPAETRRLTATPGSARFTGPRGEVALPSRFPLAVTEEAPSLLTTDRLASSVRLERTRQPLNQPQASALTELPLAVPSPGRTGFANLPGHAELPDIDVRGILPGTPVEVPDPLNPGKTIQFRVP